MSELRLDYQPNPLFSWIGATLLGLAIVVLILTGIYYIKLSEQLAAWEAKAELTRDKAATRRSAGRSAGAVDLAQEIKNANEVLRRLSVPWNSLFQAVESSGGRNVTLLALVPDIEKRQVKISGEANSFKAIMSYITQLEGQEVIGSVYLQSHDVQQDDPEKPVRFSLLATWQEKP